MPVFTPSADRAAPCTDSTLSSAASNLTKGVENIETLVIEINNKLFGPSDNMNIAGPPLSQAQGTVFLQDNINYSSACAERTYHRLVSILDRL